MPTETSVAIKTCCACGADVTGQPRMKDSQSRYWCMPCGQADQRRKQLTATHAHCAGCKQSFPKGKLDKQGEHFFCKGCLKKRSRAASVAAANATSAGHETTVKASGVAARYADDSGGDNKRVKVMTAVFLLLVVVAVLMNYVFA